LTIDASFDDSGKRLQRLRLTVPTPDVCQAVKNAFLGCTKSAKFRNVAAQVLVCFFVEFREWFVIDQEKEFSRRDTPSFPF
jgi:hypothetical protein